MNSWIRYVVFTLAVIFKSSLSLAQTYSKAIDIQTPETLNFINIDGRLMAYYELRLTNTSTDTIRLKNLSIREIADSSILFTSQKKDLQNRYNKTGQLTNDSSLQLLPGDDAIIYIELSLPQKLVKGIVHHIGFELAGKENSMNVSELSSTTNCSASKKTVLGIPFKDGTWAAIYEPSWERGHRRVIYTVNGKAHIPGRYAIDFIKMESSGKYASGDENSISNWPGYGADVLSVADGIVSSTRNDFAESPTLSGHPDYSSEMATGNYISIKIGDHQFAFYEHLKPNSIKVKVGQKIRKGEVIASLGFTGQTTGPHLHFHVADNDSPLGAEGIPFAFETFEALGSYADFTLFGKSPWAALSKAKQVIRKNERPAPNTIIRVRPGIKN